MNKRKNIPFIILLIICALTLVKIKTEIDRNTKSEIEMTAKIKERCLETSKEDLENGKFPVCKDVLASNYKYTSQNFYVRFSDTLIYNVRFFSMTTSLLIAIISLYNVSSLFKSRMALLYLKRESYKKFMKFFLKKMYRYIFVFPIFIFLALLICMQGASFDPALAAKYGMDYGNNNIVVFILAYLLNIFLNIGFYINMSIIALRKKQNYFLAVLISFLIVIGIQLFFEIIVNTFFFGMLLNLDTIGLVFNVLNLYTFNIPEVGLVPILVFDVGLFLLSSVLVYIFYKDKEKLVISLEKNN